MQLILLLVYVLPTVFAGCGFIWGPLQSVQDPPPLCDTTTKTLCAGQITTLYVYCNTTEGSLHINGAFNSKFAQLGRCNNGLCMYCDNVKWWKIDVLSPVVGDIGKMEMIDNYCTATINYSTIAC
jgi:hypothetical protein